ncbi:MAG: hypothetical protein JWO38_7860 [Gemmataceae bacterium]|nr:hypothetical protein [Gemmataceae bacterium]
MPIVPEEVRVATLRRWGISEPVIRLACGESLHDLFGIECEGPPWQVYQHELVSFCGRPLPINRDAAVFTGPPFAPLWEYDGTVTGVRREAGRLEFLEFGVQSAEEFWVLARTEQGFLAVLLMRCYDTYNPPVAQERRDFEDAAKASGFRFLEEMFAAYERTPIGNLEESEEFTLRFVTWVDEQCRPTEPGAAADGGA